MAGVKHSGARKRARDAIESPPAQVLPEVGRSRTTLYATTLNLGERAEALSEFCGAAIPQPNAAAIAAVRECTPILSRMAETW